MIKIDKINLSVLSAVRQRLGVKEDDTSRDNTISKMSPREIVEIYSGWELGSEDWASTFISIYEELKELEDLK